ncbi:coiled-coil domain-containing protein 40 [Oryzias melastigma]|uniref:coiled-coil domain-containing protein 40 n=1 Tax=Oryzias melastigma TaxID=30732 RepID=UPI000CF82D6F|nr:coiled-coil domain-containing protein 40 [Oryzias melastigma]
MDPNPREDGGGPEPPEGDGATAGPSSEGSCPEQLKDVVPQQDSAADPEIVSPLPLSPHLSGLNTSEDMMDPESPQEEFIILDHDHPLISRYEAALSRKLRNHLERINLALNEKVAAEKEEDGRMNDLYIQMHKIQEQLARGQNRLEAGRQARAAAEAKRLQTQDQLREAQSRYSDVSSLNSQATAKVSKLQAESDKVMQDLVFTQGISEDLHSKVKTMNNVKHKAGAQKAQAEEELLKQDLYLDRLTKELDRLSERVAVQQLYTEAQAEETLTGREALCEAEADMELLLMKHKQLQQQWNSSLMTITKQSEALYAMQEAVRSVQNEQLVMEREIEGYKKSNNEEQEKNEKLTVQQYWLDMECSISEKQINQTQVKKEAVQAHYSACLRTLEETTRSLDMLRKESHLCQSELNDQRKQLEKQSALRLELEGKVMTKVQQKLTNDRTAKHYQQLNTKMTALKKEKMHQLHLLENELLSVRTENHHLEEILTSLVLTQKVLNDKIAEYNKELTVKEAMLSSLHQDIEQKLSQAISCNNKIAQITANTEREDLSPLQVRVKEVQSQIETIAAHIQDRKQVWMKQEKTFLEMVQKNEARAREIRKLQTEQTGLEQRRLRLQSHVTVGGREAAEQEEQLKSLRRDLVNLVCLLGRNQHLRQAVEYENTLMEADFIHALKEAERESISAQMTLEEAQEETEALMNSLLEAERCILLWGRKTQILKETRSAVESLMKDEEIQKTKEDIHHLELRATQLKKQQERLMRESELIVDKRETLILRREAMALAPPKPGTEGVLQRSVKVLRGKCKEAQKHLMELEQTVRELQENQAGLTDALVQERQQLTELMSTSNILDSELVNIQDTKDRSFARLLLLQNRSKKLHLVSEGSYKASSSSQTVEAALQAQATAVQDVSNILSNVCQEFPQHRETLRTVSRVLVLHTEGNSS